MRSKKPSEKTKALRERLLREPVRTWDTLTEAEKNEVQAYSRDYLAFLNRNRTERKAVESFVNLASRKGFRNLDGGRTKPSRVFQLFRGKVLAVAVVGSRPLTEGMRLIASHVDSPRLDLKPNPLYEDTGLALLKSHYYGGVKKYHWVARSLALCGVVVRKDGVPVEVEVGLAPEDPILTIPDLLPHLSRKQMEQKASEFLPGENLNLIVGSTPYPDKETEDRVKLAVLELLEKKYGIIEEDFVSAEIQVVPAESAREAGLDRSLLAGYGQDDRVCAYTSFTAMLESTRPKHTAVAIFYDKEEIGSEGNTGAQSRFLEMFLTMLMEKSGLEPSPTNLHRVFFNGKALSADVTAAIDPTYPEVYEKRNNARLGYGINVTKYTGHGGKYLASDANAEYAGWVRKLFNDSGIAWQAAASGKVDEGGGGTVAKFLAKSGMEIIDCGPPLLGMHSPLELSAKDDVWMCHRAYKAFLNS
ncbi:MAG: aminopeptidase [Desulfomonile tiedjei]|nr:aminopeptidase [Desulfomonile tiedjei]